MGKVNIHLILYKNNNKKSIFYSSFGEKVSREFNSDNEDHMGEQYRLDADKAFDSNNYQQAIDLYSKSLNYEENISALLNRAISCK